MCCCVTPPPPVAHPALNLGYEAPALDTPDSGLTSNFCWCKTRWRGGGARGDLGGALRQRAQGLFAVPKLRLGDCWWGGVEAGKKSQ